MRTDYRQGNYVFSGHRYASQPLLGVGAMTEYLCADTQVAKLWRDRSKSMLRDSTAVSVGAAVAAGVIGSLVKRPLLGAVVGGAVGYLLHATQMSVYSE